MPRPDAPRSGSVDLHGLSPDQALRRLSQALHSARVQGAPNLTVITGRGWGNRTQEPILRRRVEEWLRGPDGRRLGVKGMSVGSQGGSLLVSLGRSDQPDS